MPKKPLAYNVHYVGPSAKEFLDRGEDPGDMPEKSGSKLSGPHKNLREAVKHEKSWHNQFDEEWGNVPASYTEIRKQGYKDVHDKLARKTPTHKD